MLDLISQGRSKPYGKGRKARWKSGEKTYEAERSITVPGGKRSRALVVSGTEIKE